jgi:hypothetical protein
MDGWSWRSMLLSTRMRAIVCVASFAIPLAVRATDDGPGRLRDQVDSVTAKGMTEWDRLNLERNLRWMLVRERAPADSRPGRARVGVFADAGVWHVGARAIVVAPEGQGIGCRVLDRAMFRKEEQARYEAIVLPGGWAPFQWVALGEPGIAALKAYVEGGGRCLCVCAGA